MRLIQADPTLIPSTLISIDLANILFSWILIKSLKNIVSIGEAPSRNPTLTCWHYRVIMAWLTCFCAIKTTLTSIMLLVIRPASHSIIDAILLIIKIDLISLYSYWCLTMKSCSLQISNIWSKCPYDPWIDIILKAKPFRKRKRIFISSHHQWSFTIFTKFNDHLNLLELFMLVFIGSLKTWYLFTLGEEVIILEKLLVELGIMGVVLVYWVF